MQRLRARLGVLVAVVLTVSPLAGKTHVMTRQADPWLVPPWEEIFNDGPFDLPAGATRATSVDEALALGWAALHALDDREAERAFRLAITRDERCAMGYLGLALANDGLPGRALACAKRAVAALGPAASEPERRLITAYAAFCEVRGPARAAAEMVWVREVRAVWAAAPAGPEKNDLTALLVRGLGRTSLVTEARLRLRELRVADPGHAGRAYAVWLAVRPVDAAEALAELPATPGACRAAGAMLERLGRAAEAARWFGAAASLAAVRHPADMEDWRLVEAMRGAEVAALAAAGVGDFPADVPVASQVDGWLRLEAWDRLTAVPEMPAAAPWRERVAVAHARALGAVAHGRLADAEAGLADVRRLVAEAGEPGAAGVTAADRLVFAELELELEFHQLAARGEAESVRLRFAGLRHLPPARLARLALALDLPLEAITQARRAAAMRPQSQPEQRLLVEVAKATHQRLPEPEDGGGSEPAAWPPLPSPPSAPAAGRPGRLPSWSLPDTGGVIQPLTELQAGRPTVVLFFLGHECRHCMEQLRAFDPMAARFEQSGARLVAVSIDGPDGVAQTWASREGEATPRRFVFPVLADPGREAFREWGVIDEFYDEPIHGVFVLDGDGRLRWRHLGVEPYMEVAEVLAAVRELGVGGG